MDTPIRAGGIWVSDVQEIFESKQYKEFLEREFEGKGLIYEVIAENEGYFTIYTFTRTQDDLRFMYRDPEERDLELFIKGERITEMSEDKDSKGINSYEN